MSRALQAVVRRRMQLQARSADQRADLVGHTRALVAPWAWVDGAQQQVRRWVTHPLGRGVLVAGAVAACAVLGPRRCLGWAGRAWGVWRLWRQWVR